MDFIDGLPLSFSKCVLFVIGDHFSKYAHFVPLTHPCSAVLVAREFFDNIFKLHDLSETVVCDRDVTLPVSFGLNYLNLVGLNCVLVLLITLKRMADRKL